MTQPSADNSGSKLKAVLTRKFAGIPVIVFGLIGIGLLAWYLRKRQQSKTPPDTSATADNADAGTFPDAEPMNYSSDIYVNVPQGPAGPPGPPGPTGAPIPIDQPKPHVVPKPDPTPPPPHKPPVETPPPPPKQTSVTYAVQPGDTLWGIATRFLGSGQKDSLIYAANKATIEAVARSHGFSSSNNGARIWPGEKLVIPK